MATTQKPARNVTATDLGMTIDLSFESLMQIFGEVAQGVNRQLEAQTVEDRALAETETQAAAMRALTEGEHAEIIRRRDQIIEFTFALEEREKRIRRTVQNAEALARRYKNFRENLERSVFLAMLNDNIEVIEGELHRFKLYKAPDKLEITDESAIPDEYFTTSLRTKTVDKVLDWLKQMAVAPDSQLLLDHAIATLETIEQDPYTLNKDKLMADLQAGKEIAGAYIEKDRRRIDIK